MAFCTSCGSAMDDNALLCTKCGKQAVSQPQASGTGAAPAPYAAPVPPATAPVPPGVQPKSTSALNVVLVIAGILVLFCVVIAGIVGFSVYRARKSFHVSQHGAATRVETPFGTFGGATLSASDAARKLGVELYPGAQQEGDAGMGNAGNLTSVALVLTTNDSVDQVAQFYRARFPNGFTTSAKGKFTLIAGEKKSTLTIAAEESSGRTRISITRLSNVIPAGPAD